MVRRIVQQSADRGVAHVSFGSGSASKRADRGSSDGRHAAENSGRWNTDRDSVMAHHPQDFDAASSHDPGTARDETFSRDDFHSVLSQAIAGLDRNSYAARGAIYEREYKLLMRELYSASPPLTDAEIDAELRVFRNAV